MSVPTTAAARRQAGFTLIELMTVVVILGVLATVAIGAYSKQVRNAHKTEVVSDLSNLTLRQKSFMAKSGHYASTANEEAPGATYPAMTLLTAAQGPLPWNDPNDPFYTASGATDGPYFRGGPALHGFDALQFMPEGADSWCGYATISGHGSASQNGDADVPPTGGAMIEESFPMPESAAFVARDWFFSYALCDFDFDGVYWGFSTTHMNAAVNYTRDSTGTYQENE